MWGEVFVLVSVCLWVEAFASGPGSRCISLWEWVLMLGLHLGQSRSARWARRRLPPLRDERSDGYHWFGLLRPIINHPPNAQEGKGKIGNELVAPAGDLDLLRPVRSPFRHPGKPGFGLVTRVTCCGSPGGCKMMHCNAFVVIQQR